MKPELAQDDVARQRFLREARAMASLKSDYVVTVHQVGQHNHVPFLAAEFLSGEPLDHWLQRRGRPSVQELLRLSIEIGRGLTAAHEIGLIHRDIKPANIFLESRGASDQDHSVAANAPSSTPRKSAGVVRAKILDFGLAWINGDRSRLTNTGLVMGTPGGKQVALEQVEGRPVEQQGGDLFSLGCVMYEMKPPRAQPFTGETSLAILMAVATKHPRPPREVNPELPPPLAKLILQLLAKDPLDRPGLRAASGRRDARSHRRQTRRLDPDPDLRQQPPCEIRIYRFGSPLHHRLGLSLALIFTGVLIGCLIVAFLYNRRPYTPSLPQQGVQGVSDTEILFGMTGPFNGPVRELGREMKIGINTCFEHVNDRGGVAGRKLRLFDLDDGYEPERALANMRELYEQHKVFAFVGNIYAGTAVKPLPYALDKKALFFGALTGASLLRHDLPNHHVFNFRASLAEETAAIVKHLVEVRKVRSEQVAVFAQNDAFGDDGFRGAAKMLNHYGHKETLRVGYDRNTLKINDAVTKILEHPDLRAVVMVATYKPAAAFIKTVKDAHPQMIYASVAFVDSDALAEGLMERGPEYADGVIVTQVVPPVDSGATLVLKYRELLKKYYPSARPNSTSLEGYIDAAILVEGLKRSGKDLTTETLIDALESIHDFDLGSGAPITFGPSQHQASHRVWGTVLDRDGFFHDLEMNP